MLLIVSGASGAGKSTLCHRLMSEFPELQMSVSYTTRPPRGEEQPGQDYHFVEEAEFRRMIESGAFAEHAEVHGNLYGTAQDSIDKLRAAGASVLFDIDYQGARALLAAYPNALSVMVLPPSMEVLEARLRGRGTDAETVIQRRLAKARAEIGHYRMFEYLVVNAEVHQAYDRLRAIYVAARQRTARIGAVAEQLIAEGAATDEPN
ncbi:MAG: guanylate kinase [Deltaproteobacteria bacterium]|nr:MAG: guanylate kinase [Deltaproteobacteria bacterium]